MLGYLSAGIICSEKRTVFRERSSTKTVSFEEQIMSKVKYPSIFSRQMKAIVYISNARSWKNCSLSWLPYQQSFAVQLGQVLGKKIQEVMFTTSPKKDKEDKCTMEKQIFFYFKLLSLNIRGLGNFKKRRAVVQEAKSKYYISPRNAFDNR